MNIIRQIILVAIMLAAFMPMANAAYTPFNTNVLGNIGIGSASPGQRLDVVGTVRATAFIGDASGLINLPASGWTLGASNVGISTTNNVGIGTNLTDNAGLTVMNGNVGIGTWVPGYPFDMGTGHLAYIDPVGAATFTSSLTVNPNPTFGSATLTLNSPTNNAVLQVLGSDAFKSEINMSSQFNDYWTIDRSGTSDNNLIFYRWQANTFSYPVIAMMLNSGNVGIGTIAPVGALDVNGTVRATAFIGDGSGLLNLPSVSTGWTLGASNVGISTTNNVGIGTSFTGNASLSVINGNVGIGTWIPSADLQLFSTSSSAAPTIQFANSHINQPFTTATPANVFGTIMEGQGGNGAGGLSMEGISAGANVQGLTLSGAIGSGSPFTNTPAVQINGHMQSGATRAPMNANDIVFEVDNHTSPVLDVMGSGGLGIGTNTPVGGLAVMAGNVGIGTWIPDGGGLIVAPGQGNVGIGTIRPGKALDVNGTVRATAFIGDGSGLLNLPSSSSGWTLGASNVGISTTNNVGIGTNLTDNAGLTVMNGNVGIGTWIPSGTLDLSSSAAYYPIINFFNPSINTGLPQGILGTQSTTLAGQIITNNNAGGLMLNAYSIGDTRIPIEINGTSGGSSPTVPMVLISGNQNSGGTSQSAGAQTIVMEVSNRPLGFSNYTQLLDVLGSGNVGIGTTMPQGALTVMSGNVGIGTWVTSHLLDVKGDMASTGLVNLDYNDTTNAPLYFTGGFDGPKIVFNNGGPTYLVGIGAIHSGSNSILQLGHSVSRGGGIISDLAILDNGNIGMGTITPIGGLSVMNGNVGIGTWVPGQELDVIGTVRATHFVGDGSGLTGISAGSSGWTLGASNVGISTTNNVGIGTSFVSAAGLTVMNGNIGIGTWTPRATLELRSDVNSPNNPAIIFSNTNLNHGLTNAAPADVAGYIGMNDNPGGLRIQGLNRGNGTGLTLLGGIDSGAPPQGLPSVMIFGGKSSGPSVGPLGDDESLLNIVNGGSTSGNPQITSILGSGNLGLGTAAPRGALVVMNGNVGIGTWVVDSGALIVNTGNNVGIGTIRPGQALDVSGTVRATAFVGDGSGLINLPASGGSSNWTYSSSGNVGLNTTANVGIGTSFTSAAGLTVMNGNVGIGTWAPAAILDVATGGSSSMAGISLSNPSLNLGVTNVAPTQVYGQLSQINGSGLGITGISAFGNVAAMNITAVRGAGGSGAIPLTIVGAKQNGVGIQEMGSSEIAIEMRDGNTPVIDITGTNNVGIGTSTPVGGTAIMNGNVGIGTWIPSEALQVVGTGKTINGRWKPRVVTTTQSATPSINTDNGDIFEMTGLAQAITSMTTNLTGTANDGDIMEIQITDNGTARAITWGASFESTGTVALPTTTVISTRLNVFLQWSSTDSKWQCVGAA